MNILGTFIVISPLLLGLLVFIISFLPKPKYFANRIYGYRIRGEEFADGHTEYIVETKRIHNYFFFLKTWKIETAFFSQEHAKEYFDELKEDYEKEIKRNKVVKRFKVL